MTELHEAVIEGEIGRVRRLLKAGADVNAPDEDGATPLHYAAAERDTRIIRLLLEGGADHARVDKDGRTAEDWAFAPGRGDLEEGFLLMGIDACQLYRQGAPPSPEPSALEQAIRAGDLDQLALLIGGGTGETSADQFTFAPIITAVQVGRPEVVEFFVKRGADVNREDQYSGTLLHAAVECGQLEVVRALLDLGARTDVPGGDEDTLTPLQIACRDGHTGIAALLLQRGADPNLTEQWREWTALHQAAYTNRSKIIRLLLKYGAKLHARTSIYERWRTALELAAYGLWVTAARGREHGRRGPRS